MSATTMAGMQTLFSGAWLDRASGIRADAERLAEACASEAARFVPVWQSRCLVESSRAVLLRRDDLPGEPARHETIFLGVMNERYLFAVALDGDEPPLDTGRAEFMGLRRVAGIVSAGEAAVLGYARAMVTWQYRHRHCGSCGAPNEPRDGGFVMACTDPGCGARSFPRLDPAIIVLVQDGERCLLGRQSVWPDGFFSTIAGFVEPGESLEDAVRREVEEETDIRVGRVQYLGSQPWPFPSALMVGFHAQALSTLISCNDGELAEARWLSRAEIAAGAVRLPPRSSIAFLLIEEWFNAEPGRNLASLNLEARLNRPGARED